MNECYGDNFMLNGELQPVALFDNSLVYEGESIYEVLRLVKGTPVFFNDHMERLTRSLRFQRKSTLADAKTIRKVIISLIRSDKKKEVNIKIVFNYNNGTGNWLIYYLESVYPTEEQYRHGVKGILFNAVRKDPESKVINHRLRTSIYQRLIMEKGYEALLVNEEQFITEGSRTNIFFIRGEVLYTAPENMILSGITRKHILAICAENGIKVELSCAKATEIGDYEAVFMTGTSPMLLPFHSVGQVRFNVGLPMMQTLRSLYLLRVAGSINSFRSESNNHLTNKFRLSPEGLADSLQNNPR
jgi:branched-chain amino acid aminotransferase